MYKNWNEDSEIKYNKISYIFVSNCGRFTTIICFFVTKTSLCQLNAGAEAAEGADRGPAEQVHWRGHLQQEALGQHPEHGGGKGGHGLPVRDGGGGQGMRAILLAIFCFVNIYWNRLRFCLFNDLNFPNKPWCLLRDHTICVCKFKRCLCNCLVWK